MGNAHVYRQKIALPLESPDGAALANATNENSRITYIVFCSNNISQKDEFYKELLLYWQIPHGAPRDKNPGRFRNRSIWCHATFGNGVVFRTKWLCVNNWPTLVEFFFGSKKISRIDKVNTKVNVIMYYKYLEEGSIATSLRTNYGVINILQLVNKL